MPDDPGEAKAELDGCDRRVDGPVHPARSPGIRSERQRAARHCRSDQWRNKARFVARDVRAWIEALGAKTAFIEPGSPWENGHVESFNARMRAELLNGEIFHSLREAQIIIEGRRKHYNTKRPHSASGYRPPAPETIIRMEPRPVMHQQSNRTSQIRLPRLARPFKPLGRG